MSGYKKPNSNKTIECLRTDISRATKTMTKTVSFKVGMTCGGCKGAVTRILSKIEGKYQLFQSIFFLTGCRNSLYHLIIVGVTEVQADVDTKVVNVLCEDAVDEEVLHSALKNWGEKANKSVELVVEAA